VLADKTSGLICQHVFSTGDAIQSLIITASTVLTLMKVFPPTCTQLIEAALLHKLPVKSFCSSCTCDIFANVIKLLLRKADVNSRQIRNLYLRDHSSRNGILSPVLTLSPMTGSVTLFIQVMGGGCLFHLLSVTNSMELSPTREIPVCFNTR
jgi:hypothetical protein